MPNRLILQDIGFNSACHPSGSVNKNTSKSWEVKGHIHVPRQVYRRCIRGLAASAGIRLRATEMEISAAPWSLEAREGLYCLFTVKPVCYTGWAS